jgi:hypothetical protein
MARHIYITIPAGQTRWVNINAYIDVRTRYSPVFNLAGASAGLDASVRFIVLEAVST